MSTEYSDYPGTESELLRHKLLTVCLWAVFAAGLLVEALAPRLQIENHAFVMPSVMVQGSEIHPAVLVEHERHMQLASLTLTVGGAMALAFWYRRTLASAVTMRRDFDSQSRR